MKTILVRLKGPEFSTVVAGGGVGVGDGVAVESWLVSNVGRGVGVDGTAVGVGVGGTRVPELVGTGVGGTGVGVTGVRLASASAVAAATCVATGVFLGTGVESPSLGSELHPPSSAASMIEKARPVSLTFAIENSSRTASHFMSIEPSGIRHNPLAWGTSHGGRADSAGATTYDGRSRAILLQAIESRHVANHAGPVRQRAGLKLDSHERSLAQRARGTQSKLAR